MRALLTKWVGFYKAHRRTLLEPVVHLRRPDMQSWDGWMHVRPFAVGVGEDVAVAMLFNPTERTIDELIRLPLYYAGVEEQTVELSINEGPFASHPVGRGYDVRIPLKMAPKSATTIVVRKAAP